MKRVQTFFKIFMVLTVLGSLSLMALFVVGVVRYDGSQGLWRRVKAEFVTHRPDSVLVPTPFPTPLTVAVRDEPSTTETLLNRLAETPPPQPTPTTTPVIPSPTVEADLPTAPPTLLTSPPTPEIIANPDGIHQPAAEAVALKGLTHMWQKWNNCGPATLAMNLSLYGSQFNQLDVAGVVKPNSDDKNVSPDQLADFARTQGYLAEVRVNGNPDLLRLFLSNGIPILIETWLEPEPNDGMGHYRLITGYDNAAQQWIAYDSYVSIGVKPDEAYQGIRLSYEQLDYLWYVFNGTYILIYPPEKRPVVESILGAATDPAVMWEESLAIAQQKVREDGDNAFAWFNLGSSLVAQERYEEAAIAYDQARIIGLPWRMLWYQFGPFNAYYETGRYEELLALAKATNQTAGNIEEVYYWQGMAWAGLNNMEKARAAWEEAIKLNANYNDPVTALAQSNE